MGSEYYIRYSPNAIFSGNVPSLDINFIEPGKKNVKAKEVNIEWRDTGKTYDLSDTIGLQKYGYSTNSATVNMVYRSEQGVWTQLKGLDSYCMVKWSNGVDEYALMKEVDDNFWKKLFTEDLMNAGLATFEVGIASSVTGIGSIHGIPISAIGGVAYGVGAALSCFIDNSYDTNMKLYKLHKEELYVLEGGGTTDNENHPNIKILENSASILQKTIAKWYKALRTFALVGLLSVLVYIGIRIIISSSSDDKAKYKKNLMNWLAAVCIVFLLHYMMTFMINMTTQITQVFVNNNTGEFGRDELMSSLRTDISSNTLDFSDAVGKTIMYIVLIIYTGVFSVQYLNRVLYVAFLTMIAPLIALTYPLDKIKDGKAQAFSMWLKEYIFNCLLQPVHLLLYTIFVGSAVQDFALENPLYGIVAIGFLIPAEKFFRKMFGMESQTSVGTIGAAAGGALVMSMLSKLKGKPPKEEAEKQQKSRTASYSNSSLNRTNSTTSSSPSGNLNSGQNSSAGQNQSSSAGQNQSSSTSQNQNSTSSTRANASSNQNSGAWFNVPPRLGARNQVIPVWGQKFARGAGNVIKTHLGTKDAWKRHGKRTGRTILRAAGGLTGFLVGVGAGVGTGSFKNAVTYGMGGAVTVASATENAANKVITGVSHIKADYQKGAMGTEEYNNKQFDKQFWAGDDGKILLEKYKNKFSGTKAAQQHIQGFLDRGITDTKQIDKMIKNNITPDKYSLYKNNGISDVEKMVELEKEHISPEEFSAFANEGITDIYKMKKAKEYAKKYNKRTGSSLTSEALAKRMAIVNTIPKEARNSPKKFKNHIRTRLGLNWSDDDIKEFYNEYYNLW